ncbi:MAG: hypothetical protein LBT50_07005 [Prevotellaceae bacterium]|jgi:hypothetical protein|nr:hypothetical protein [Prevotellaceae bacterium]
MATKQKTSASKAKQPNTIGSIAEIEQLTKAEQVAYRESQKHYWDLHERGVPPDQIAEITKMPVNQINEILKLL